VTVAISADDGCACVELADHHGECWVYEVRAAPSGDPGWKCWAVERRGDDPEKEHAHRVRNLGKTWLCSCKAFKFNRDRAVSACKHVRACREVLEFYRKLTGVES
jgi:hypothetical protein